MLDPLSKFFSNMKSSILLGGLVFVLSYPNIYYFSLYVFPEKIGQKAWEAFISTQVFLITQIFTLIFLLFLCAFCGLAFSKRYELPGLGDFSDIRKNGLRLYLPLAAGLIVVSYVLFDRWFMAVGPKFYPKQIHWALSIPFRSAFMEELVFRFGMLTVAIGAIRRWFHPLWAIGAVSLFYAITLTLKTYDLVGLSWVWTLRNAIVLLVSFGASFLLGYVYLKRGLISSIFLHFLLALKYVVFAIIF